MAFAKVLQHIRQTGKADTDIITPAFIQPLCKHLPQHPLHFACHNCGMERDYQIAALTGPGKRCILTCLRLGTTNPAIAAPLWY